MGIRKREHVTDEELSLLIDGVLDERTARRVQEHIRQCRACYQRYEELRQTVMLLHKTPRVSVPRAFTLTEADVANRARRKSRALPWMRWATALVAAMLAVVVGLDLVTTSIVGTSSAPPPQPKMALQAERVTSTPLAEQQAKPALAPAARAVPSAPTQALLRAQGEEPQAKVSSAGQSTAVPEVDQGPEQEITTVQARPSHERAGWPWYRWAEVVLLGTLLLLIIFQVVLQ